MIPPHSKIQIWNSSEIHGWFHTKTAAAISNISLISQSTKLLPCFFFLSSLYRIVLFAFYLSSFFLYFFATDARVFFLLFFAQRYNWFWFTFVSFVCRSFRPFSYSFYAVRAVAWLSISANNHTTLTEGTLIDAPRVGVATMDSSVKNVLREREWEREKERELGIFTPVAVGKWRISLFVMVVRVMPYFHHAYCVSRIFLYRFYRKKKSCLRSERKNRDFQIICP